MYKKSKCLRTAYNWISQFADPLKMFYAMKGLFWYLRDWFNYSHLPGAEPIRLRDTCPQLHDRTATTKCDVHYFYVNGWAMRRILSQHPLLHVDIGSQTTFVNLLGAVLPVTFVDYRALEVRMEGLTNVCGDIQNLSFADDSISSLSCLHVAEHIGLGRYGDPLNPNGTRQACAELRRVLAPGGNLYFAIPIGKPRVCFNAHRIHTPETVMDYFKGLELVEFSGMHDDRRFVEHVGLDEFANSEFACGMFWFKKR